MGRTPGSLGSPPCRSTPRALAKDWWTVRIQSCLPDATCQTVLTQGSYITQINLYIIFLYCSYIVPLDDYPQKLNKALRNLKFWTFESSGPHMVRQTAHDLKSTSCVRCWFRKSGMRSNSDDLFISDLWRILDTKK